MPSDLSLLDGTTFTLKFSREYMNISNENGGGDSGADFYLNPNLNYTPFI